MNKHGVWFIYVKRDRRIPCTHCTSATVGTCPYCLGTGYKTTLTRTRAVVSKPPIGAIPEGNSIPGLITDTSFRVYFAVGTSPTVGDFLLEVEWNVNQKMRRLAGEPKRLLHVLSIEQSELQYWEGQGSFYATQCEVQDSRISVFANTLRGRAAL